MTSPTNTTGNGTVVLRRDAMFLAVYDSHGCLKFSPTEKIFSIFTNGHGCLSSSLIEMFNVGTDGAQRIVHMNHRHVSFSVITRLKCDTIEF